MKTEEEVHRLKRRVTTMESAITLLTELADRHSDRFEEFTFSRDDMRSDQANLNEKINALIDAQIRNEDKQLENDAKIKAIMAETELRLKALIDAQIRSEDKQIKTDAKFAHLAESQKESNNQIRDLFEEQREMLKVLRKIVEPFGNNGK